MVARADARRPPLLLRLPNLSPTGEPVLFTRRGRLNRPLLLTRPDAVAILTVYLALLFLIPARLVIGGLGAAGRPSLAVALSLTLLWMAGLLQRPGHFAGPQPVRWLIVAYVAVSTLSYAAAYDRGMSGVESRGADRWMIATLALAGLAVTVADSLPSRAHLDIVVERLVGLTSVMAFVGALQFLAHIDLTRYVQLPGLRPNSALIAVGSRGDIDLARVFGTASHYIEFSVVLAIVLPLALHRALFVPPGRSAAVRWAQVAVIGAGIPFAISRSGAVGLAAALGVCILAWRWSFRLRFLLVAAVGIVVFRALQPGLLGTIRALFTNAENDPSVQTRISDYAYVERMWTLRPWFGRGGGTLLPDRYILLDNQYLNTLLSAGVVGLLAFVALFVVSYVVARSIRLRGADQETRNLGQALAASMVTAAVCSATFDSLSFAIFSGVLFLLIGIIGALWRLDAGLPLGRPLQPAGPDDRVVASPWMAAGSPVPFRPSGVHHAPPH